MVNPGRVAKRIDLPETLDGRGITIAVVDSFACPHPDVSSNAVRAVWMVDGTEDGWREADFVSGKRRPLCAHGVSVACAAAGTGVHPGTAPAARLLLVNGDCSGSKKDRSLLVGPEEYAALLRWVLDRAKQYDIRVLVLAAAVVGDSYMAPWQISPVCRMLEELTDAGILCVCIASNTEMMTPPPPAGGPSVLTVGGVCKGFEGRDSFTMYQHCWGTSVDGRPLPDLVVPCDIEHALLPEPGQEPVYANDGEGATSLAAPQLGGIAALCLQANPGLGPRQLRSILLVASMPLSHLPAERQGAGLLDPRRAVALARTAAIIAEPKTAFATGTLAELTDALASADSAVRCAALNRIWWYDPPNEDEVTAMVRLLDVPYPEVVSSTLYLMARFPALSVRAWTSSLAAHPSPHVRCAWGRAAVAHDPTAVIGWLLGDADKDVRWTAAMLSCKHGSAELRAPLIEAMRERGNWPKFCQCRTALQRITGQSFACLRKDLPEATPDRLEAMRLDVLEQWVAWSADHRRE